MRGMKDAQPGRRVLVTLLAAIVALLAFIIVSALVTGTFSALKLWSAAGLLTVIAATAAVGLVVARHQPRNPIGWLLAGAGAGASQMTGSSPVMSGDCAACQAGSHQSSGRDVMTGSGPVAAP